MHSQCSSKHLGVEEIHSYYAGGGRSREHFEHVHILAGYTRYPGDIYSAACSNQDGDYCHSHTRYTFWPRYHQLKDLHLITKEGRRSSISNKDEYQKCTCKYASIKNVSTAILMLAKHTSFTIVSVIFYNHYH